MNQRGRDVAIRNAFYPQAGIGISANALLLGLHVALFLAGPKPRLTDLPVAHLALTHILMLLTMALLVSADVWEAQDVPADFKCKVLVFLHKVARGLSICTTCVLSVLQAITVSPSGSWLARFKFKPTSAVLWLFLLLWVLNVCISSNLLHGFVATSSKTQPGLLLVNDRCSFLPNFRGLFLSLMAFRDVFFVGLMVLSSAHMVVLLHRHQQRARPLRSSRFSPNSSPEQRATRTILLLLGGFAVLYCVDLTLSFLVSVTWTDDPVLRGLHMIVANGYGTVSPLLLISADTHVIKALLGVWENKALLLKSLV